jgi:hypothetical protein
VALGKQRTRSDDLSRTAASDQHAGKPGMKRQPPHLFAHYRQTHRIADLGLRIADRIRVSECRCRTGALDKAQPGEQRHRRLERLVARPLEPLERAGIAAPRDDVEAGARQVDPVDFRLAMRAQTIARVPQPADDARRDAAGPAGALVGRIGRDALGLEAVDAALGVVARDFVEAGVDNRGYSRHGQ